LTHKQLTESRINQIGSDRRIAKTA